MSKTIKTMIDPDDAVMLLIDHQSGLFQLVADMDMLTLRNNVSALAKVAHLGKIPTFPTLSALAAGYKVFNIIDASGNWSKMATEITLARVVQAGAMPIDTYAVLAEIMSTWNRADAMEFATVMVDHIVPHYRLLMESYDKAQSVEKVGHETTLDLLDTGKDREATQAGKRGMQPAGMTR